LGLVVLVILDGRGGSGTVDGVGATGVIQQASDMVLLQILRRLWGPRLPLVLFNRATGMVVVFSLAMRGIADGGTAILNCSMRIYSVLRLHIALEPF
jgi:hypothetical protein